MTEPEPPSAIQLPPEWQGWTEPPEPEVTKSPVSPSTRALLEFIPQPKDDVPAIWTFSQNDDGRAMFVLQHFGDFLRYVPERKLWRIWHGHRWHDDRTGRTGHYLQILSRHQQVAAEQYLGVLTSQLGQQIKSEVVGEESGADMKITKKEVRESARSARRAALLLGDERIISAVLSAMSRQASAVAPAALWDADPYMVGTRNGVLNLHTGEHRAGQPGDYITKELAADFDAQATAPAWEKFVNRILTKPGLAEYVQRLLGYSLTGLTNDHAFYFCYGSGNNGKSIFLDTIAGLFNDYALSAAPELLQEPANGAPCKANIAQIPGVRFLYGSETSEGKKLREGTIKELTAGNILTGEEKFCAPFSFAPCAKLWVSGNHKPTVTGTDTGIWRRPRLVPFTETIKPEEKIPQGELMARLAAERAGVLNWMLAGWLSLPVGGEIPIPQCVREATNEYRREQDLLGEFISDATQDAKDNYKEPMEKVYAAYKAWADENGIRHPMTKNLLTRRLEERGWQRDHRKKAWLGKSIVPEYAN